MLASAKHVAGCNRQCHASGGAVLLEADILRSLFAKLRTIPAASPGDAADKLRALAGLCDDHGRLDHDVLGESVAAYIERVASELDAL